MIQFANPWVLWALPLALVPLLIRRWRRPAPPPVVPFSATRLLEAAARQVARRQRLREWLLLAVRMLILATIVLAFARPYEPVRGSRSVIRDPWSGVQNFQPAGGTPNVVVIADPSDYVAAAIDGLAPVATNRAAFPPGAGPGNALVFLGATPANSLEDLGVRSLGLQHGQVGIAAPPFYQPALAPLDESGHAELRGIRVRRWWKLEPLRGAMVIARFSNGDPWLIEHWTAAGKTIVSAVPADPAWSDLPLHPEFVPLLQGLVRYLAVPVPARLAEAGPRRLAGEGSRGLLGAALLLALAELWLGGLGIGKLGALLGLIVVLGHPEFSWRSPPRPRVGDVVILLDRTESTRFRAEALDQLLPRLPRGETLILPGAETALGEALLSLTNRPVASVILLSDGQHNRGVSPVWAAATLHAPVFTVAVGEPSPPRDVSITAFEAPDLVFAGEPAVLRATLRADGYDHPPLAARLTSGPDTLSTTNISTGDISWSFSPPHSGSYALRVTGLPGEADEENNVREFALTVIPEKIRVGLRPDAPDWEFRQVRHALERDPAVELVAEPDQAAVVVSTTHQTWRLQAWGGEVFQRYWSGRVRAEFLRVKSPTRAAAAPVSEERYVLWRNDALLQEVARVSGGAFLTGDRIAELPQALRVVGPPERRRFDLRDSWLLLGALAFGFIVSWAARRRPAAPVGNGVRP